jgi:hypothetical protein
MSADESELQSWVQDFLFGAPLYVENDIGSHNDPRTRAYHMFVLDSNVEGYCPYCQKNSTFHWGRRDIKFLESEATSFIFAKQIGQKDTVAMTPS